MVNCLEVTRGNTDTLVISVSVFRTGALLNWVQGRTDGSGVISLEEAEIGSRKNFFRLRRTLGSPEQSFAMSGRGYAFRHRRQSTFRRAWDAGHTLGNLAYNALGHQWVLDQALQWSMGDIQSRPLTKLKRIGPALSSVAKRIAGGTANAGFYNRGGRFTKSGKRYVPQGSRYFRRGWTGRRVGARTNTLSQRRRFGY